MHEEVKTVNIRDRRRHPRADARQFGKIYEPRCGRYFPCTTCNISEGGAFIEIARPLPLAPGDRLLVGLAAGNRPAILRSKELFPVEVLRSVVTTDHRQGIAVRFVEAKETPVDAALRLAA